MESQSRVDFYPAGRLITERGAAIRSAVEEVLQSGLFVNGPHLEEFEQRFSTYLGVNHCVGVGNGLDALRLALEATGVEAGDEVIVPGYTFAATLLSVLQAGAIPVAVDVSRETGNVTPESIRAAITTRTTAIVVVHLHGFPAPMAEIRELADTSGLLLIEDAAQAHGATVSGAKAGAWGDAAAFSFYPTKNLGALGDGGCVITRDELTGARVRQLANYGSAGSKYSHQIPGWNSRLDEIQASILNANLDCLDEWNAQRRRVAKRYLEEVPRSSDAIRELRGAADLELGVWHHFVLLCEDRDTVSAALLSQGIETDLHYPRPAYALPAFSGIANLGPGAAGSLPNADWLACRSLSLPIHPWLDPREVEQVCAAAAALEG